jgi:thiamine-monophosphate kinase
LVDVGPGDDAAVVQVPDGRVVATTDTLIERVHFRTDWADAYDIGRRAAATSLADISAMGATASALLVALSAPATTSLEWTLQLAQGISDEADVVGAVVVGGDLTRAAAVAVTVTAMGDLAGRVPVLRAGARPGDIVAIAGRLGWADAGLAVLSRGFNSPRALVAAYRRPEPPYASGPAAAEAGATAMADVSDGLLADLGHIAQASGVTAHVQTDSFVVADPLAAVAAAYGTDPMIWVLTGGQDHALVATFAAGQRLPEGFVAVGHIESQDESEPRDLVLVDGIPFAADQGYRHF